MICEICLEDVDMLLRRLDDPNKSNWYCEECRSEVTKYMYKVRAQMARDKEGTEWQQLEPKKD